jgi:hypothetical protein
VRDSFLAARIGCYPPRSFVEARTILSTRFQPATSWEAARSFFTSRNGRRLVLGVLVAFAALMYAALFLDQGTYHALI